MSLDFYLEQATPPDAQRSHSGIFIRDEGAMREISREEWDERFPGREPVMSKVSENDTGPFEIFERNITHNLGRMADAAGIYRVLWRPEEIGIERAWQAVEPLKAGIAELRSNPRRFKALNPENGWGNYEGLLAFADDCLAACEQYPDALVRTCR